MPSVSADLISQKMKLLPARLESLAKFRARAPQGKLLVPNDKAARPYGMTPYENMDSAAPRVFNRYLLPKGLSAMNRVIVIGNEARPLKLLRTKKQIGIKLPRGNLILNWVAGQNSIHDQRKIADGRDIGNVIVTKDGKDFPYDVTFAFAFKAFRPDGKFHLN